MSRINRDAFVQNHQKYDNAQKNDQTTNKILTTLLKLGTTFLSLSNKSKLAGLEKDKYEKSTPSKDNWYQQLGQQCKKTFNHCRNAFSKNISGPVVNGLKTCGNHLQAGVNQIQQPQEGYRDPSLIAVDNLKAQAGQVFQQAKEDLRQGEAYQQQINAQNQSQMQQMPPTESSQGMMGATTDSNEQYLENQEEFLDSQQDQSLEEQEALLETQNTEN